MGLFSPFVLLLPLALLTGLVAVAVVASRTLPGTDDAVVVTAVVALLVTCATAAAWTAAGATGFNGILLVAAVLCLTLLAGAVYRRVNKS